MIAAAWRTSMLLTVLPLCLSAIPGQAAQAEVAQLKGIEQEIQGGRDNESVKTAVPNVRIRREAVARPAPPDARLLLNDGLLVDQGFHVKAKVDEPSQGGELIFFPRIRDHDLDEEVVGPTLSPGDNAEFEILSDADHPGNFAVKIVRGGLVGRWTRGRLRVYAAGNPVDILGTKLMFKTSADGDRALLFVDEGTVAFPLAPGFEMPTPVVELRRGQPVPIPVTWLRSEVLIAFGDELKYNEKDLWRVTKWPWLLVVVPAVVVSVVCVFECGDDAVSGTVIVEP